MINIVKPVPREMSNAMILHLCRIYTVTNYLTNYIEVMLLQANGFELFEEQKALLYQWYHEK